MFDRFAMANLTGGELNALVKIVGGEDAVRRILRGELVVGEPGTVTKVKTSASQKVLAGLLELECVPVKTEAVERFVARDKLVVDRNAEVPISYIGDNLKTNFSELVEENVPAVTLKQRKLLKSSVDGPILSALGGQTKAKIALAQVWQFLKVADRTKWFLFYVADANGIVWAVDAAGTAVAGTWLPFPSRARTSGARAVTWSLGDSQYLSALVFFCLLDPLNLCHLVGIGTEGLLLYILDTISSEEVMACWLRLAGNTLIMCVRESQQASRRRVFAYSGLKKNRISARHPRTSYVPHTIQSREYSKDSGMDGAVHTALWAVNANWNDSGWNVNALSVSNPNKWSADNHVVSRYSISFPTQFNSWVGFCLKGPFANRLSYVLSLRRRLPAPRIVYLVSIDFPMLSAERTATSPLCRSLSLKDQPYLRSLQSSLFVMSQVIQEEGYQPWPQYRIAHHATCCVEPVTTCYTKSLLALQLLQKIERERESTFRLMRKPFIHTYEDIISTENLLEAWREFLKGKHNRSDVQDFSRFLMHHVRKLREDLEHKSYTHGGYTAFKISDPKPRDIHKALVRDRLLHHAIYRQLYPLFDRTFIADSYSCRKNKGMHKAMERFHSFAYQVSKNNTRTCWVLKCDIRKFFASIDQEVLMKILRSYISDEDTIDLLRRVVISFSSTEKGKGLPLGNLTSQLLVNIYMNEFDQFAKHVLKARHYIRYADDFLFMSEDRDWLESLLPRIEEFLGNRLKLELHPSKVSIGTLSAGVDFLGWVHFLDHKVLRTSTKRRMFRSIQSGTSSESYTSYKGILVHGNAHKLSRQVDAILAARSD